MYKWKEGVFIKRKVYWFVLLLFSFLFIGCSAASESNNFPNKSIQLFVVFSPGGGTDNQARIIAKYANKYLDQELVIINKPGGGGRVGWNQFTDVQPDGYTLAAYNLPHIITQPLVGTTTFSTDTFEPIVNWGADPTVFAVKNDSEIKSLEDLITKAKQAPGRLTVGHSGKYVGQHLGILQLENAADIDLKDVAFDGSTEANASLLGDHIDAVAGNLSGITRLGEDVRPLAIATEERHSFAPDVPTLGELGYPDVIMSTDRGIAAKEGTPEEVIAKLEDAFLKLFQDEDFLKDMEEVGANTLIMNREEAMQEIENRVKVYEALLQSIEEID
ncbi:tripartite tricarboxylate transporter substrate binding protein [Aquibacillus albus]|uniref:Tripartite-type tricarboxylate transporter receptor subunit TctC n=1 Tax=Aquibacillus albus TaxID=1168171 RepID=A0ABS2MY09_9BACI|nr:tripartite tricarboxylate transporter substrate binding protein [Aquibacillus albus]MBM7570762.1 tripartite-type tricarboxylate transporter receptor subunit TctC [Aquibacillus albus]